VKLHLNKQRALKKAKEIYDNLLDSNEYEKIFFPTEETYNNGIILKHIPCDIIIKKTIRMFNLRFNYHKYIPCGNRQCANLKRERTNFKIWGVENPFQSEEVQKKYKKTCMERYGVEFPAQSEKVQEKMKKTNFKIRGVENPFQSEEVKKKIKQTNFKILGVENPFQSEKIKKKIRETCNERYGVEFSLQSEEVRAKIKQTNFERYGFESPLQSEEIKEKIKQTNLERYKAENPSQSKEVQKKKYQTMKKNNSFHTSKPEEKLYSTLCTIYGKEYIIRQYKDNRYPFNCDFYVKDFDFFIELNKWQGHGKEPYDPNNKKHQDILKSWEEKTNGNDMYFAMINVWTKSDPYKRKVAKENNLNYLEVF